MQKDGSTDDAGPGDPTDRYLIPIPGFTVPAEWSVGRVTLYPPAFAQQLMSGSPPAAFRDGGDVGPWIEETLQRAHDGALAEVAQVDDEREAVAAVRTAIDVLRVFEQGRRHTRTLPFGLPGEVPHGIIEYVRIGRWSAPGWMRVGEPPGGGFSQDDLDVWNASVPFQFLSEATADPSRSEGWRRAVVGAQLLSRALVEQRPDVKMLGIVAALEAWLLQRDTRAQTYRLARHIAWFGCGRHSNNLCGRDRPICPYLHLEPGPDNRRLRTLRELGNTYGPWRCSEWHQVVDWYDSRSDTAHGGDPTNIDSKQASSAAYWVSHYLVEPILEWLRTHEDDPVGDLRAELGRVSEPTGWQAMLEALDADQPPTHPPDL